MEILVIGAVRVAGSLLVLRWAFVGGMIAILVDLSDLLLIDLLDPDGPGDYRVFDEVADQVYLFLFPFGDTAVGGHGTTDCDRALRLPNGGLRGLPVPE